MDNISDIVSGEEIAAALTAEFGPAVLVRHLSAVDSTNSWLKELEDTADTPPLSLVFTDSQTAGRGTRGRDWLQTSARDIALSLGVRIKAAAAVDQRLSLAIGALVAEVLETATSLPMRVKWANDVPTRPLRKPAGPWLKVCGILIETCAAAGELRNLIVGVGVNVNSTAADYPAGLRDRLTTLSDAVGHRLRREVLLMLLGRRLVALVRPTDTPAAAEVVAPPAVIEELIRQWLERDVTAGSRYTLCRGGAQLPVTAVRVDAETCGLWVSDEHGREHLVSSYTELEQPL